MELSMKDKIIRHSIALFESKGFSETSIQDIVDTLGVTKGTFYYYFTSKEQLLTHIHLQYIDYLLAEQQTIFERPDRSCQEKLAGVINMMIREIAEKGASARIFFRELIHISGEDLNVIKGKRDQFRFNLQSVIEQGMENGEFRNDIPADMMTFGILGACNWCYTWFNPEGAVSDVEVASIYTKMFLNGLNKQ
ncbi:TetR/AcrR family transcriptional regulator [Paenibacillus alvei A6-6i-x]|nr:TetR/AcrR family transcriptional regulator [Paenibacillus alvei A6-6i-x]GAV10864.1 transcriptional regulator protein [Paenibacillus sp. NAIST15-1]